MKNKRIKFMFVSIMIVLAITILPGAVFAQAFEPLNSAINSFVPSKNSDADQEILTFSATEDLQPVETTSQAENITAGIKPAMMWGWDTNRLFKGDKICMGTYLSNPMMWNILSPTTANITKKQSSPVEDEYLALRDDSDKPVSAYDAAFLIADYTLDNEPFDSASIFTSTQKYAASSIRGIVSNQLTQYIFNPVERRSALRTTKTDELYTPTGSGVTFGNYDCKPMSSILNLDKLFLISACEFDAYNVGCDSYSYWFRSPYQALDKRAGFASLNDSKKVGGVGEYNGIRPAFNLNTKSVAFVSSCQYGKPSKVGSDLSAIPQGISSEYKLTITEPSRSNFKASINEMIPDGIKLNYDDAVVGKNEYVSAVIKNSDGRIIYYGKVTKSYPCGIVDVKFSLPSGDYVLGVFNEQCNDDSSTDYASRCSTFQLHIA